MIESPYLLLTWALNPPKKNFFFDIKTMQKVFLTAEEQRNNLPSHNQLFLNNSLDSLRKTLERVESEKKYMPRINIRSILKKLSDKRASLYYQLKSLFIKGKHLNNVDLILSIHKMFRTIASGEVNFYKVVFDSFDSKIPQDTIDKVPLSIILDILPKQDMIDLMDFRLKFDNLRSSPNYTLDQVTSLLINNLPFTPLISFQKIKTMPQMNHIIAGLNLEIHFKICNKTLINYQKVKQNTKHIIAKYEEYLFTKSNFISSWFSFIKEVFSFKTYEVLRIGLYEELEKLSKEKQNKANISTENSFNTMFDRWKKAGEIPLLSGLDFITACSKYNSQIKNDIGEKETRVLLIITLSISRILQGLHESQKRNGWEIHNPKSKLDLHKLWIMCKKSQLEKKDIVTPTQP